ncbi:MAG: hypothetical protein ACM31L_15860 [Actinomycetota bacterium]
MASFSVVYLMQVPFTAAYRARWAVDWFISLGAAVTVVDVGDLMVPQLKHDRAHYGAVEGVRLVVATPRTGLAEAECALDGADVVFVMAGTGHPEPRGLGVLRMLSRARAPKVMFSTNVHPSASEPPPTLLARLRRADPLRSLVGRLPLGLLGIRPFEAVVIGGRKSEPCVPLVGPQTHRILAHAADWDVYRDEAAKPLAADEGRTALYIDTWLGYHPDSVAEGHGQPVDPAEFYPRLRRLFDRVEAELGLEVVIAAHPRADYYAAPGLFGARRIVKGGTAALVRSCRLGIGCHSTASSFAVLFGKPLMIIATRSLDAHPTVGHKMRCTAAALGTKPVFIDDPDAVDLTRAYEVDQAAYRAYVEDYIMRAGSSEDPYWVKVMTGLAGAGLLRPDLAARFAGHRA